MRLTREQFGRLSSAKSVVSAAAGSIALGLEELEAVITELREQEGWNFPVGSVQYPTEKWYCACWHDPTGARNGGYQHTGIDLNVDVWPRGDIDRGQPAWAVTGGTVHAVGYDRYYLGGIVVKSLVEGAYLWWRYWHLEFGLLGQMWAPGDEICAGDLVGHIGNYTLGAGGDHVHLDCARHPFEPNWWFTRHPEVQWVDPLPILERYLDPALVEKMVERD